MQSKGLKVRSGILKKTFWGIIDLTVIINTFILYRFAVHQMNQAQDILNLFLLFWFTGLAYLAFRFMLFVSWGICHIFRLPFKGYWIPALIVSAIIVAAPFERIIFKDVKKEVRDVRLYKEDALTEEMFLVDSTYRPRHYYLLPIGEVRRNVTIAAAKTVKQLTGHQVEILPKKDISELEIYRTLSGGTVQYDGRKYINTLLEMKKNMPKAVGIIGVTESDLGHKGYRWTTAPTRVGQFCAIVSTARLHNSDQESGRNLFLERLEKVIYRAVRKNMGGNFCSNSYCAGHSCGDNTDIDRHILGYCPICREAKDDNFVAGEL